MESSSDPSPARSQRTLGQWMLWITAVTLTIIFLSFTSLLVTSEGLSYEQRRQVDAAIDVLERAGFSREVFALRYVVSYRGTDNWWNEYVGHQNAYAATNYPFAVITVYPAFFRFAVDDVERAAILLHESHHLFGADEATALQRVWLDKRRIGWTAERYGHTRVWRNTREWTARSSPALFACGVDRQADCVD